MTRKLEFRVMPSSVTGCWDVMSREVPTSANRTPGWSLMTTARDATEIGETILEEVEFKTVSPEFLHFMIGSSSVQCGAPMRQPGSIVGWDLGTCTTNADKVTCPDCLGAWGR